MYPNSKMSVYSNNWLLKFDGGEKKSLMEETKLKFK